MLYSMECAPLPTVAWPDRGLSSLSVPSPSRVWDSQSYSSIYRIIENYKKSRSIQQMTNEPTLPKDPRQWSREDVAKWIQYTCTNHQLPTVHLDRFVMNGKALCLMTMDMFVSRVPLGGKLLYKDFQLRLSSALYR